MASRHQFAEMTLSDERIHKLNAQYIVMYMYDVKNNETVISMLGEENVRCYPGNQIIEIEMAINNL